MSKNNSELVFAIFINFIGASYEDRTRGAGYESAALPLSETGLITKVNNFNI